MSRPKFLEQYEQLDPAQRLTFLGRELEERVVRTANLIMTVPGAAEVSRSAARWVLSGSAPLFDTGANSSDRYDTCDLECLTEVVATARTLRRAAAKTLSKLDRSAYNKLLTRIRSLQTLDALLDDATGGQVRSVVPLDAPMMRYTGIDNLALAS